MSLRSSDGPVSFDTETTSLDETTAQLVALSFAGKIGNVRWAHTVCLDDNTDWGCPEFMQPIVDWIEDPDEPKILSGTKYDAAVLHFAQGITLRGVVGDTVIMSKILDDHEKTHGIDALSARHLGRAKIPTAAILGTGKTFRGWGPVPRADLATYANEDVMAVLDVYPILKKRLEDEGLMPCADLEHDLLPAVSRMEIAGMKIDPEVMADLTVEFGARRDAALEAARAIAQPDRDRLAAEKAAAFDRLDAEYSLHPRGKAPEDLKKDRVKARSDMRKAAEPLNLGSPNQLVELIYGTWELHRKQGLRHPKKTKKGNPSTDADTMEELAPYSEFCQQVVKYREVAKLVSTYTEKLPKMVNPKTGRIHSNFNQVGAGTGRFTNSDPNLQNIPNRTEEGRRLRAAFIPEKGYLLLAPDYSQVEMRVEAHLSGEPVWTNAFLNNEDIHEATAASVGCDRNRAKTVNYGSLYGAGAPRIAQESGLSVDAAQRLLDAYWAGLPCVRKHLDQCVIDARATGFAWTMDKFRRRHLPDINHKWGSFRSRAENAAGNTPVQGTAADIMKKAMVVVDREVYSGEWDARIIATIHDELLIEVREDQAEALAAVVKPLMENVVELCVPLVIDMTVGTNWMEAH